MSILARYRRAAFRRRPRLSRTGQVLGILCLSVGLVWLISPVLALSLNLGDAALMPGEAVALMFPTGRRGLLLVRSVGLAAAVAVSAITLGGLASLYLCSRAGATVSWLRWLLVALWAVPSYIHALAWATGLRYLADWLGQWAGLSLTVSGWGTSWWVQTMTLLPMGFALGWLGWRCIDPDLLEAARVQRSMGAVFRHVMLPLAVPYLAAGAGLLFVLNLLDFSTGSLFQVNVYALEPMAHFSATGLALRALLVSFPLIVICFVVVGVMLGRLRQAASQGGTRRRLWAGPVVWPSALGIAQKLATLVALGELVYLPTMLIVGTGGRAELTATVLQAADDFAFTGQLSIGSAMVALVLSVPLAHALLRQDLWGWLAWALMLCLLAWPAALTAVGAITLWSRLAPHLVYGRWPIAVFTAVARHLPWAALVLQAHLRRLHRGWFEAAALHPVAIWRRWLAIDLPLLLPGLLLAATLVAVLASGELGSMLLVVPPGRATVSMRIYNYLHYGASTQVAALCLVQFVGIVLVMGAVSGVWWVWWRLSRGSSR